MDSIIINQLMFGIRNVDDSHLGGHVQNMETKERWGWRADQVENYDGKSSIFVWISKKLGEFVLLLFSSHSSCLILSNHDPSCHQECYSCHFWPSF
jgi:hypothetical protein